MTRVSRRDDQSNLLPVLDRLVEHRYGAAISDVAALRTQFPEAGADELADRLIRRYARELAVGGAMSGGAAASPVAGVAVAAASAGVDATYSVGRLGEMIMAIGLVYGHDATTADERRTAVVTIMGLADGAAVGVSGLAARAGAKGGARLLQRIPTAAGAASPRAGSRALSRLGATKGPWSLTALIPYGIGAGVGAAGNALLARAVGRAAKEYFAGRPAPLPVRDHDVADAEIVDAQIIDADVIDAEVVDVEIVDAEIIDAEIVD